MDTVFTFSVSKANGNLKLRLSLEMLLLKYMQCIDL